MDITSQVLALVGDLRDDIRAFRVEQNARLDGLRAEVRDEIADLGRSVGEMSTRLTVVEKSLPQPRVLEDFESRLRALERGDKTSEIVALKASVETLNTKAEKNFTDINSLRVTFTKWLGVGVGISITLTVLMQIYNLIK